MQLFGENLDDEYKKSELDKKASSTVVNSAAEYLHNLYLDMSGSIPEYKIFDDSLDERMKRLGLYRNQIIPDDILSSGGTIHDLTTQYLPTPITSENYLKDMKSYSSLKELLASIDNFSYLYNQPTLKPIYVSPDAGSAAAAAKVRSTK